ncbi:MAG: hypothetical protein JWM09_1412 [Francisellaceae bacterium]|nr:hypothetical protein [Francisellaceae bacterium]
MHLEEILYELCIAKKVTLGLAESCTGGKLAARITRVPGASHYFMGSIVAYSNQAKIKILKLNEKLLNKYGAVSERTAVEMLYGAFKYLDCDYGLAITGVAGPNGDESLTPIGTIYVALGKKNGPIQVIVLQLTGSRVQIINKTASFCLKKIINFMQLFES